MKKIAIACLVLLGGYYALQQSGSEVENNQLPASRDSGLTRTEQSAAAVQRGRVAATASSELARAFEEHRTGYQSQGVGTVVRILSDDNDGSRHQRFILELVSGQTLLIAHNIDLAPRITALTIGDTVAFFGEYEWNAQGGVIHWTHRDPRQAHVAGWLEHNGQRYQ